MKGTNAMIVAHI